MRHFKNLGEIRDAADEALRIMEDDNHPDVVRARQEYAKFWETAPDWFKKKYPLDESRKVSSMFKKKPNEGSS